ncbi:src kinase-associated phosphoprotein 1-like [Centrocercus urophasianus]|uniref:src kinase-associated phosphoprotein 1-like n=1 Tax=Centrocercus urophasianus TaxID=9002 RepID=UPI001C650578|nr:src kinase-associated phosphoprotein 1-like [Centrocercus urophasianus]
MIPEDIQRLLEDAECFLVDGLQNENLSPRAREQRNTILYGFQQAKARYHLEFLPRGENQHDAGFGQDSSDENQSWSLAPSVTSEVSLPLDLQDDVNPRSVCVPEAFLNFRSAAFAVGSSLENN